MTTQQRIELIKASETKIRSLLESLRGYPGLIRPRQIRHEIIISEAVIRRLDKKC